MKRHEAKCKGSTSLTCYECGKVFQTKFNFDRHNNVHEKAGTSHDIVPCTMCDKIFNFESSMKRHFKKKHENKTIESNIGFVRFETLDSNREEAKKVSKNQL